MQIKSWYLALTGFLFGVLAFFLSDVYGDMIYYPLVYFSALPVVLLVTEKDSKRPIAIWLWFATALYLSFDYRVMLFLELLMRPVLIIAPAIMILIILPVSGRQEKGAILSIMLGILMVFVSCGTFLSQSFMDFFVMISILSAFFSISAGIVYFSEENK